MTSTPTGKALLLVQSVLSLHHFLKSYIPQNLGVSSKVTTLVMDSMFFFANRLLHLQVVFRVAGENANVDVGQHYTTSSCPGMICTNILMKPTKRVTNRVTANISGLPTYDISSIGYILYHRPFGSPLCSYDCQQINSLIFFIFHCFHLFEMFILLI